MASRPQRSLKHEYELFVEEEIENYKESIPRNALLSIGDEAARILAGEAQLALTELLLCEEVDRLIFSRLRLPSYQTWRRRRLKAIAELGKPEHWGINPDRPLVKAVAAAGEGHVLVAGVDAEGSALYLAARGCDVTAIDNQAATIQRVIQAAEAAGLSGRLHAQVADLSSWAPESQLAAVVCTPAAFRGLTKAERARAIAALQRATAGGGVHLVDTIAGGKAMVTVEELRARYQGWEISIEASEGTTNSFLARKGLT